jgi:hypothetical protein
MLFVGVRVTEGMGVFVGVRVGVLVGGGTMVVSPETVHVPHPGKVKVNCALK